MVASLPRLQGHVLSRDIIPGRPCSVSDPGLLTAATQRGGGGSPLHGASWGWVTTMQAQAVLQLQSESPESPDEAEVAGRGTPRDVQGEAVQDREDEEELVCGIWQSPGCFSNSASDSSEPGVEEEQGQQGQTEHLVGSTSTTQAQPLYASTVALPLPVGVASLAAVPAAPVNSCGSGSTSRQGSVPELTCPQGHALVPASVQDPRRLR
jgi:hypothetical protein